MSPLLYNIYIGNLNSKLSTFNQGCQCANIRLNNLSYADNLVLLAPLVAGLQQLVHVCEHFASEYDVLFNDKKSFCMRFCPRTCKLEGKSITKLFGKELVYVEKGTYLGHILTCDSCDEADIQRQYMSLCIRSNSVSLNQFPNNDMGKEMTMEMHIKEAMKKKKEEEKKKVSDIVSYRALWVLIHYTIERKQF
ncbi:uncharacterized protein LOC117120043 [Anneissia japonica]|uniref:uncharacterized protein LOC117120043 n=1 Tax=Anneissia japonica TaxID=1529436 RepID=UPI001425B13D|nr:uncharacterized protein LOC117120043 [Anneissia japonica]